MNFNLFSDCERLELWLPEAQLISVGKYLTCAGVFILLTAAMLIFGMISFLIFGEKYDKSWLYSQTSHVYIKREEEQGDMTSHAVTKKSAGRGFAKYFTLANTSAIKL